MRPESSPCYEPVEARAHDDTGSQRKRTSTHRSPARFAARMLPGARPGPFPGFIAPCNPTLKAVVPTGERWLYEIKHDGYRIQAHLAAGKPALLTRSGLNWTGRLRSLVAPLNELPASSTCISISTKHVGKVGTGFSRKVARELHQVLAPLAIEKPPVATPVRDAKTVWVRPNYQAEIEYRDMTGEGLLRHAAYKRLRR